MQWSFFLTLAILIGYSGANCPDRWVTFRGSCYLFGVDGVHFTEAESYCRQHNGHLVEVDSKLEDDFLRDYMHEMIAADHWLGMTDETVEGTWVWFNNKTDATYKNWGPGQPGTRHNAHEDCAAFSHLLQYRWMDAGCLSLFRPVCEKM